MRPESSRSTKHTRRWISDLDILCLSLWGAFVALNFLLKPPVFLIWSLAGGLVMICRHWYVTSYKMKPSEHDIFIAALAPMLVLGTGTGGWIWRLTPRTVDAQLAALDLGIAPAVRRWTLQLPSVSWSLHMLYDSLPFFFVLCMATIKFRQRIQLTIGTILGGALVPACYLLCPAVGPIHVDDPAAPRNCMPSMHLTWALLLFMNTRGKTWKWFFGLFALFTAWSTLSTGEHYFPDLVAAVPFAWLLDLAASRLAGLRWIDRTAASPAQVLAAPCD